MWDSDLVIFNAVRENCGREGNHSLMNKPQMGEIKIIKKNPTLKSLDL